MTRLERDSIRRGEDDPMEVDGSSHGGQGGMIDQSGMDFYYQDLMKYIPTLSHFLAVQWPSPKYLLSKCPLLFFPPPEWVR